MSAGRGRQKSPGYSLVRPVSLVWLWQPVRRRNIGPAGSVASQRFDPSPLIRLQISQPLISDAIDDPRRLTAIAPSFDIDEIAPSSAAD